MTEASGKANRQIARAAGIIMPAFVLSNLVGLVRQILVSKTFGTSAEIDAFNTAATYPDLIFSLIAGGALASAFLPTLTEFLTRRDQEGAWRLSSALINLELLVLSLVSLVSILFAPQIVQFILAPDYNQSQQELTAQLLQILLIAPTIFGVSGLFMGILNSHQVFLWPALAPTMFWTGMILGVVFLSPTMGIFGLAWGYVIGAGLHLGIQLPAVLRLPARRYYRSLGLYLPAVRQVVRLMGPRLLGVAIVQLNFVINAIIASGQPVGSLTSIKYAWAIMTMPQVVIAQAIAIAALPTFSVQVAQGNLGDMRRSLASTLRGVILLSLPASMGLIFLSVPLITVLFQRGEFTEQSTEMVSWALFWFSMGLLGHGLVEILARAYYALKDTLTPVLVGTAAMSLNVLFSFGFSALFESWGWMPHGGLALANSLATALEMVGLLVLMRRRLNGLEGGYVLHGTLQSMIATLVMCAGLWGWNTITQGWAPWIVALGGVVIGAGIYAVVIFGLRVEEGRWMIEVIKSRRRA